MDIFTVLFAVCAIAVLVCMAIMDLEDSPESSFREERRILRSAVRKVRDGEDLDWEERSLLSLYMED